MKKRILAILLGMTMLAGCGQQVQTVSRPEGINIPSSTSQNSGSSAVENTAPEADNGIRYCTAYVQYNDNTSGFKYEIEVYVDGYSLGKLDNKGEELYTLNLEKGEHEIRFVYTDQRESYAAKQFTVDRDNAHYTFHVESTGNWDITTKVVESNVTYYSDQVYTSAICTTLQSSEVYDAKTGNDKPINIYVDGKLIGTVASGTTSKLPVQLQEGMHRITFSRTGYEAESISHIITVLENGKTHNFVCDNFDGDEWLKFTCFYEGSY